MKKRIIKILAAILSLLCFATSLWMVPATAAKNENAISADEIGVFDHMKVKKADSGVRITFEREAAGYARAYTKCLYSPKGDGTQIDLTDFSSLDNNYSMVVMLGNTAGKFYDSKGYLIIYGKSGYFSIVAMDGVQFSPTQSKAIVREVREELPNDLSIRTKRSGADLIVTVNQKQYTIPASGLEDPEAFYYTFGVFSDGDIKGLDWNRSFKKGAFSFTVSGISNRFEGEGFEPIGDIINGASVGISASSHVELRQSEKGIQVGWTNDAAGYERARFSGGFPISSDTPLHLVLTDIYSASPDYSVSVMMTNANAGGWYDSTGYIMTYGKSGDFSVIGTDGVTVNVNKSKVITKTKREALGDKLTLDVSLNDNKYTVTANGKSYTFDIDPTYIQAPGSVFLVIGIFGDGDIQTLNWNKDFKKAAVSLVISNETFFVNPVSTRELKPFAKYEAFMGAKSDKNFKPDDNITRGEAIKAMAKLIANSDDIKGVYSSDYKDLKKSDKDYDVYAFMERCDYMPDFGEKLEPNKAITKGELLDLVIDSKDSANGVAIADMSENDDLYKKACYAVNNGIFTLDPQKKFNKDEKVTRGEAAKIICTYIGKTSPISNPKVTFSDVKNTTAYKDYILLAANSVKCQEKTYKVKNATELKKAVNDAVALSKSADSKAVIELANGTYSLDEPIKISGSQYGDYEIGIQIRAAKNANPIISGNKDIKASAFKKVSGKDYYSYQLPETAKVGGKYPQFRDLYLDGERMHLARSDTYLFTKTVDLDYIKDNGAKVYKNGFYVEPELLKGLTTETVSPMELCINIQWTNRKYNIKSVNADKSNDKYTQISVSDECWHAYSSYDGNKESFEDWTYWMENHLSLLDQPGEFFYDDDNGIIYMMPYKDTDMSKTKISYPLVEQLFYLDGASNITFDGLTFTGTTSNFATVHGYNGALGGVHGWNDTSEKGENKFFSDSENTLKGFNSENIHAAGIYGYYTDRITVKNCSFDELGTNGLYLRGGNRNAVVKGNSFTDIAMAGIVFGRQGQSWSLEEGQSNLIIDNNYVYNIGTDYKNSLAINVARVKNLAVTHNSMIHTPYSGLMVGWIRLPSIDVNIYNAEIAYNHCEDNLYACNDGAGLYVCGANAMTNNEAKLNRIHDNFIKSTGYTRTYNGIYMDMNASNWEVYNNVIEGFDNAYGPVFPQDHIEDQYTYNISIFDNFTTVRAISTTATPDRRVRLTNNTHVKTAAELPDTALAIIKASGQNEKYASTIRKNSTDVSMAVVEPHIIVERQGNSAEKSLVFTVKNNGNKTAKYSAVSKLDTNGAVEVLSEPIELKAGETGTIEVTFRGGDAMKKALLYDFDIVKDNGWKTDFYRVIEVDVSNAVATAESTGIDRWIYAAIGGAAAVIIAAGVAVFIIIKRKKKQNRES